MALVSKDEGVWRSIAIVMVIFSLIITTFVILNYREQRDIAQKPAAHISGRTLILSRESKQELIAFLMREPNIVAVSAVSISLVQNHRKITFFESKEPGLFNEWRNYEATKTQEATVFAGPEREYQNSRITSIINGNFECRATKVTQIQELYNAAKYAPFVCSMAVPPGFDSSADFTGYINFFMKDEVTDSEKARLTKEAIILSSSIYRRDISRK